jgi:hypothetical protein
VYSAGRAQGSGPAVVAEEEKVVEDRGERLFLLLLLPLWRSLLRLRLREDRLGRDGRKEEGDPGRPGA